MAPAPLRRLERWNRWYGPARFGLMFHWGLNTGGGSSEDGTFNRPFQHETPAALESAAPPPDVLAANLVATAKRVGAAYATFTAFHSCDRFCILYPSAVPGFVLRTTHDYVGAFINACVAGGIKAVIYLPAGGPGHLSNGAWLSTEAATEAGYGAMLHRVIRELAQRHGGNIAGFWLDGNNPAYGIGPLIRTLLPEAMVISNNDTSLAGEEVDVGTTELLWDQTWPPPPVRREPEPAYDRPGMLRRSHSQWFLLPAMRDFNEDLPTCNDWWDGSPYRTPAELDAMPYVTDPTFWVKQMLAGIGQRRRWNHCLGLGPQLDGTVPPRYRPMVEVMAAFMNWASSAVHGTIGGEGSAIDPGWVNDRGFVSVTVDGQRPSVHYVHVTTAPAAPRLALQVNGCRIVAVSDLRTGAPVPWSQPGWLEIRPADWEDVRTFGAAVFRVEVARE